ncbi:long-chain-fatty-acid--CoA ligase 5 [Caerostris extrusa]|uniref:Long-chain-fatty-acid--CoA ligase 5 n=1 Tax=Caerostris extrusa TaxID=172846 RepID=A0AAV4SA77_CAEEX|nr:long-chain-fatty-acid--CoA ligase 5 [Caerostris extrusa]
MSNDSVEVEPEEETELVSIEIPNSGGARKSKLVTSGDTICHYYEDTRTTWDIVQRGQQNIILITDNGRCFGSRSFESDYSWITYNEFIERAQHFGRNPGLSHVIRLYHSNPTQAPSEVHLGIVIRLFKNPTDSVVSRPDCFYGHCGAHGYCEMVFILGSLAKTNSFCKSSHASLCRLHRKTLISQRWPRAVDKGGVALQRFLTRQHPHAGAASEPHRRTPQGNSCFFLLGHTLLTPRPCRPCHLQ